MLDAAVAAPVRVIPSADERRMRAGLWLAGLFVLVALVLPLGFLFWRSFQDPDGNFVGLSNYVAYVTTPALLS
jgi:iron(III) transport system permease protein